MKPGIFYITILTLAFCICFNSLHAQGFSEEEFVQKLTFEEKLTHIRGIMVEGDERASTARSQKKIDKALQGFLETEFMQKYKEIKLEAETLVAAFKAHSQKLAPDDVREVKKAYAKIADKFNMFLVEIKYDFMDRKKLKTIHDQPDMYSNSLQYKLSELKDEYSQDFQVVVAEATGSELYSAVPLVAIFGLIKLAVDFTNYLATANFEARRIKEEHLRDYFLMPYSFRSWEEIEISEGDIYNHAMENQDYPQENGEVNPFEEETNSAKPKPKKKNNDQ
ncbi:MAG: hypothetical protein IPJ74_08335 [Saprospiraceae bacterium]|nr:hypothetical protein [Saprospiraceae bacterium]